MVREQLARSQFSSSALWVPGIELGHQGCWQVLQSHLTSPPGATFKAVPFRVCCLGREKLLKLTVGELVGCQLNICVIKIVVMGECACQ